ncbi:MAG: hypothetical protein HEQ39_06470 [Rhizobacter sp.]
MTTTTRMKINMPMGMKRTNTQRQLRLQAVLRPRTTTVIPAKAGIQGQRLTAPTAQRSTTDWIPAFAGMTGMLAGLSAVAC